MPLTTYLAILRRRWLLLLFGPALAVAVAFFISDRLMPTYRAETQILVINQTTARPEGQLNDLLTNEQVTNTYVQLIQRREILQGVITSLRLPLTVDQLQEKLSVSLVPDTQLIRINVRDADPELAASIANQLSKNFISDLDTRVGRAGTVTIAESAQAPKNPVGPNTRQNLTLALVLGLALSVATVAIIELQDDLIRTPAELSALGVRPLGNISRFRSRRSSWPTWFSRNRNEPMAVEDFRRLRTNIRFAKTDEPVRSLLVTSYGIGEGKSTIAANLATALSQGGDRVILVDADLRRPVLHRILGLQNSAGLSDLLRNDSSNAGQSLLATNQPGLQFLPAGEWSATASDLLTSRRLTEIIRDLQNSADVVVIDSAGLRDTSDAAALAAKSDEVILVVERGRTRSRQIEESMKAISSVNGTLLGAVLNKQSGPARRNTVKIEPAIEDAPKSATVKGRVRRRKEASSPPSTGVSSGANVVS